MKETFLLQENFTHETFSEQLSWFCEPQSWKIDNNKLILQPDAETDFWARTHYGFINDNGHCLWMPVSEDFILTTKVSFTPKNQYDQAGLVVRISADCWLKTSVEFEPDQPNRLGVVVTNHGYSDWSTQDVGDDLTDLELRITRDGQDYTVEYRGKETTVWSQMRVAHLHDPSKTVNAGLYACSPIDSGYTAEFETLTIAEV